MNYIKSYTDFLKRFTWFKRKMKVVFDCSNGTTGLVIRQLSNSVIGKLEIILINEKPDGNFPAHGPNPMAEGATEDLKNSVLKNKADLGVIFDADGDRVFFLDDLGKLAAPAAAITLLSKNFKGPIVLPVNVGISVRDQLEKSGKKIIDSKIGHYFVKKLIRERKIAFAAEISGHYYFQDFFYADSGIFGAIQFLNAVSGLGEKLSYWIARLPKYHASGELNFKIRDKEAAIKKVEKYYSGKAEKISRLDGLTMEANAWWLNLRPSNTEDLVRLNFEAKEKAVFEKELENLKSLLTPRII